MSAPGFAYFDSTQPGAPVLTAQAGKLIAVLDWVLVGKGGWDKVFTGTNLAAYRSQTGNRFYLRVDDTQALLSRLRGYRAMTTVSAGTLPFPTTTQGSSSTWGLKKGQTANTVVRRYWGIRSNRYICIIVQFYDGDPSSEYYNQKQVVCFGDAPSLCEADAYNTVLLAGGADGQPNMSSEAVAKNMSGGWPSNPCRGAVAALPDGSVVSPSSAVTYEWLPVQGGTNYSAGNRLSGRTVFAPYYMMSDNNVTSAPNGAFVRLRLPNIQQLFGGVTVAGSDQGASPVDESPIAVGGRMFLPLSDWSLGIPNDGNVFHATLLEMTDTDGCL